DRIPSRLNLLRRRVLPNPESALCLEFVSPRDLLGHFEAFVGLGVDRKARNIFSLVWLAVVWSIWKSRNDVIFSGRPFSVDVLVDRAKRSSWIWFSSKTSGHPCSFYGGGWNPLCAGLDRGGG
ncbi:hypothetical protein TSUD_424260, partial [Trifolium subterraneum]